jgi:hypothetical protein
MEPLMSFLLYIAVFGIYLFACYFISKFIWRKSESIQIFVRFLLRTIIIAFLFSPTFFACGGIALTPFPILLYSELTEPVNACSGQIEGALEVVVPFWVIFSVIYLIYYYVKNKRENAL